jgi:hypothetical protein
LKVEKEKNENLPAEEGTAPSHVGH